MVTSRLLVAPAAAQIDLYDLLQRFEVVCIISFSKCVDMHA